MKPNLQTLSQREKLSKPSKYKAVRTTVDGVTFASRAEAKRDGELHLMQRGNLIQNLRRQPVYEVEVNGIAICKYIGDWSYEEFTRTRLGGQWFKLNVKTVCEDKKGVRTPVFNLKLKLVKALYSHVEFRLS